MKIRVCSQCKTPVQLMNFFREFVCPKCGLKQQASGDDLRHRVSLTRAAAKSPEERSPVVNASDFSRRSFREAPAPRRQRCSCDCNEWIEKDQVVFVRAMMKRGRPRGESRIIDLDDHYDRWFERVARKYARKIASSDSRMKQYLGEV